MTAIFAVAETLLERRYINTVYDAVSSSLEEWKQAYEASIFHTINV